MGRCPSEPPTQLEISDRGTCRLVVSEVDMVVSDCCSMSTDTLKRVDLLGAASQTRSVSSGPFNPSSCHPTTKATLDGCVSGGGGGGGNLERWPPPPKER